MRAGVRARMQRARQGAARRGGALTCPRALPPRRALQAMATRQQGLWRKYARAEQLAKDWDELMLRVRLRFCPLLLPLPLLLCLLLPPPVCPLARCAARLWHGPACSCFPIQPASFAASLPSIPIGFPRSGWAGPSSLSCSSSTRASAGAWSWAASRRGPRSCRRAARARSRWGAPRRCGRAAAAFELCFRLRVRC